MFLLLEKVTPFKNVYEYDVFENDIEINYSNILFNIKIYLLVSNHKDIKDNVDAIIFNNTDVFKNFKISKAELIKEVKKSIKMELCEIGIHDDTQIDIMIAEG